MKQSGKEKYRFPIFRERFRELQGDMSNTEFAEFLDISRQTVGFYCNGERIPDALGLKSIAERCNVSADWLLGLSNTKSMETDLKTICHSTGLSEHAAEILCFFYQTEDIATLHIIDHIITDDELCSIGGDVSLSAMFGRKSIESKDGYADFGILDLYGRPTVVVSSKSAEELLYDRAHRNAAALLGRALDATKKDCTDIQNSCHKPQPT